MGYFSQQSLFCEYQNTLEHIFGRPNPSQRQRTQTTKGITNSLFQSVSERHLQWPGASFYWELWSSVRRKKHSISVLERCSVCLWWVKRFWTLHLPVTALGGICTATNRIQRAKNDNRLQNLEGKSSVWLGENIDSTMLSWWIYWQGGCDPTDLFVWAPLSFRQCSCCGASSICTVFVLNGVEGLFPDEP